MKGYGWIIWSQEPDKMARHAGPVCWINVCLRCAAEEPVYEGPVEVTLFASKNFIKHHAHCK